jgi:hypothetical protein
MKNLTSAQIDNLKRLKSDFKFCAENLFRIRTKDGAIESFKLNKAQLYIHERLEKQLAEQGKVRAIILKGRQQGCSTLVAARFFHKVLFNSGQKAFILAHREDATTNLYSLVERYYSNLPDFFQLKKIEDNAKRLTFQNDSGYGVGTAGSGEIGRSDTIQALHMSEASFYENDHKLIAGIMQTVPNKNTEIIIESTANGKGNMFHAMVMDAMQGKNGFELIFIPWFWQDEYREKIITPFELNEEEKICKEKYNLDDEQMLWRRNTISVMDSARKKTGISGLDKFRQEYPCSVREAFEGSMIGKFFDSAKIAKAQLADILKQHNKIIVGLDVAGSSHTGDRTVFSFRNARHHFKTETYRGYDTSAIIGRAVEILRKYNCYIIVDKGYNPGVYDGLINLGWGSKVFGVHFGQTADNPDKYKNKRAEMYDRLREWLDDEPVKIEDDEELEIELLAIERKPPDANGRLILVSKDELKENKEKLGFSPDKADALALTFAYLLATYEDLDEEDREDFEEVHEYRGCKITGY